MLEIIGVRHHSPACARLVRAALARLRPAYVLIEGPADMNARLDELTLGHRLPIAVFTSSRSGNAHQASWSPFCDYSPEWVALTEGRAAGAEVRFIDLPAWHPAFGRRPNRYADVELRYAQAVDGLCAALGMDNTDTLWDHLAEIDGADVDAAVLTERLNAYFDLLRGAVGDGHDAGADVSADVDAQSVTKTAEVQAESTDTTRESYMAAWIAAAVAASPDRPVLVVCGGFHRPALLRLAQDLADGPNPWPEIPAPLGDATAVSYLVPYSFRRLDAFEGYQSGMPSPAYYQRLWEQGPREAAASLMQEVVARLRKRNQTVSTADLISARVTADGLAAVRGHQHPGRADLLDGLVSALVTESLEQPLPWTGRGSLAVGTHPAVVEMVAALSGERVGRLHRATPLPPLVHDAEAELERAGLTDGTVAKLDLTDAARRETSRLLHRLGVLRIPGITRRFGPTPGDAGNGVTGSGVTEEWVLGSSDNRLPALIEAGGYGPTVAEAARARLAGRIAAAQGLAEAASALFDAVLCGISDLSEQVIASLGASVGGEGDIGALGAVLAAVLALWRHDRILGADHAVSLGAVIERAADRLLWLTELVRGAGAPAEPRRINAVRAVRDAVLHGSGALAVDRGRAVAVMGRIASNADVPPDLRGAAYGFGWSLGERPADAERAVRGAAGPAVLGDWLSGLFALAREQILEADASVITVLDRLISAMTDHDLLVALPALRQAFSYFPPRERETIAQRVLRLHGIEDSGRMLLRARGLDPMALARARELDSHVQALLLREGLVS
jgi:uncharacterized protein DUF5682